MLKSTLARLAFLASLACVVIMLSPVVAQADTSDPGKTTFVHYASNPIISGTNLYAPALVKSGSTWYLYYGGQLTPSNPPHDEVYLSTTTDNTLQTGWSSPSLIIANGAYYHVNDPSVVLKGSTWYMALTTTDSSDWCSILTSSDGTNWPSQGTVGTYYVSFTGATVTSCARPSLIWDAANSRWELYFDGSVNGTIGQHVAYSSDSTLSSLTFAYQQSVGYYCDADIKLFNGSYIAAWRGCGDSTPWTLQYATSTDGLSFTTHGEILAPDPTNSYDIGGGVTNAGWAIDGSSVRALLFGGTDNSCVCTHKVGIAFPESASAFDTNSLPGLGASSVLDADPSTFYSSLLGSQNTEEWLALDLGSSQSSQTLIFQPRSSGYGFPDTFTLQSSPDGATWTNISGQSYSGVSSDGTRVAYRFSSAITTEHTRIDATVLGQDNYQNYYLQMADMFAQGPAVPLSSSENSLAPVSNAVDGDINTFYSSYVDSSANTEEWLSLGFNSIQHVTSITITPRQSGNGQQPYGFPTAFSLQYSLNGSAWTPIQSYSNYTNPGYNPIKFTLSSQVNAAYFRIDATTLTTDQYAGNYYLQIAEMSVQ
jgi:F5/8 type C domain